jgi:curved DNA-binding protein CbpA
MSHYKALGVSPTASRAEIKKAYSGLVRQYHPDAGKTPNNDKMVAINLAWGTLQHEDKRAEYDKSQGGGGRPAAPAASPPKADAKPAAAPTARPTATPRPTTPPPPRPTAPPSGGRPPAGPRAVAGGRGSRGPLVPRPTAGPVTRPPRSGGPTRPPQPPTAPPAAPTPSATPARPTAPTARPQRSGGGISGLHTAQFGHLRSAAANGGQRQPWIRRSTAEERTGGSGRFTVTPLFNVVNAQNPGPFADVRANPERYATARMTPMQRDAIRAKREAEQTKATNSAETKRARAEDRATRASEREGRRQSRQTFRVNSQMQKERMQRVRRWLNSPDAGPRGYSADTRHVDPVQPRYDAPPALPAGRGRRSRAK